MLAHLGEQVTAQQRSRRLLVEDPGLPGVGHVGCGEVAEALPAEVEHVAVGEGPRRPVGEVVHRHHAAEGAEGHLGSGCGRQPLVQAAALVGLDVTEADPAQAIEGDHRGHRLGHQGEQRPHAGVEQEGLVPVHEDLVERHARVGHERRDPVDVVGDLVDGGLHAGLLGVGTGVTRHRSVRCGWVSVGQKGTMVASRPGAGARPASARQNSTASSSRTSGAASPWSAPVEA